MFLGRICQIESFREWVVSVQREDDGALEVPLGSFVGLEDGLVGAVVGTEQQVPDEYVGRDLSDDEAAEKLFPGNIVDRSYYRVLGLGTRDSFEVDRQPRLRESVHLLEDDEVRRFHESGGEFSASYLSDLLDYSLADPEAAVAILRRLDEAAPEQGPVIESLKTYARRVADGE